MLIKTDWNLGLLYRGNDDPRIEKDMRQIERAVADFSCRFKGKNFTRSPQTLAVALRTFELLYDKTETAKPWWYFALKRDLNTSDNEVSARAVQLEQRLTKAKNQLVFFTLAIGKISKTKQNFFLCHQTLRPYWYWLKLVFLQARHQLSEPEETLVNLLTQTSYDLWIQSQEKLLNQQMVSYGTQTVPLSEAISRVADWPKDERRAWHGQINQVCKSISHFAEAEINAIYNYKKLLDERRRYKKPYSATILNYENQEREVERLVALVSKYFFVSWRFYKLQARLLGEAKITLADRAVKLGEIKKKFDWPTSVSLVRSALAAVNADYAQILDRFLVNGQLSVYPRTGKKAGAYCWGMGVWPSFLLLNHVDNMRSLETLAHEFGHALHTEQSKSQPPFYRGYSITTAEVASTFFEQLIQSELEKHLSAEEKIVLLHNRLIGDMASIFRQIACFNFESELHRRLRAVGQLGKEEIASLMVKHLQSYLGSAVAVTADDGYYFVYWSHLRRFFYVYTYAYGQLVSRALLAHWQADRGFSAAIDQFLSAGRSMSPAAIFKSIGLDPSKPAFFETGLKSIERDVIRLEKLTNH